MKAMKPKQAVEVAIRAQEKAGLTDLKIVIITNATPIPSRSGETGFVAD